MQSNVRRSAIQVYDATKDAPEGDLWCPISGSYHNKSFVKAVHIVPHRIGPEAVDYIFGNGSGARLDTADNCVMMHATVEMAFDKGFFVLLPLDPDEKPIKRWKIQMTNSSAALAEMGHNRLQDMDGTEVQFKNDHRPAARFLYFHFVITLLRNKSDRSEGWEKSLLELPTGKPFATMGPYIRKSMLSVLAKMAGDLNEDVEAELLGEENVEVFDEEGEKLRGIEEQEIARRIFDVEDVDSDDEVYELAEDSEEDDWLESGV